MSQENVEAVRALYEQFSRGDFSAIERFGDEFEFVTSPDVPDAGTYRGEAARRWVRAWVGSFEQLVIEPMTFVDAGDKIAVEVVQRGRPHDSTADVEGRWWFVHTLHDGTPVRTEGFPDRAQALEAAGLRE
jgi:ketosteroid isomerase-like protein